MSTPPPYRNTLSVGSRFKGIPYRPEKHAEGENYGFKVLKGKPDELDSIPELQADSALRDLVARVNAAETGLLSIGCLSASIEEGGCLRHTGYVEFAFNSKTAISDATSYFPVFFHFAHVLESAAFPHRTHFDWELEPAAFRQCGNATGYTCTIYLNTWPVSTLSEAQLAWSDSLAILGHYLQSVPAGWTDTLYAVNG